MPEIPRPSPASMPPRRQMPASVETAPRTYLEATFGFRNEAFGEYMFVGRFEEHKKEIQTLQAEMAESDHPVVQFAAGSAAVELALGGGMFGGASPENAFTQRKRLLAVAAKHFLQSAEGLDSMPRISASGVPRKGLDVLKFQARQFVAHMPLLEPPLAWKARYNLPETVVQADIQKAREDYAPLVEAILRERSAGNIKQVPLSLVSEVACALVGSFNPDLEYWLAPTTIRKSRQDSARFRASYAAMPLTTYRRPVYIHIETSGSVPKPEHTYTNHLVVSGSRQLRLVQGAAIEGTLQAFLDITNGRASSEAEERFAALGRALTKSINDFDDGRRLARLGE